MKPILIAAAALALSMTPASAAKMMNCSGDGMMKVNSMVSAMPMGPKKMMMDKEVQMASMSLSKGDMRGCNKSLMKAQKMK